MRALLDHVSAVPVPRSQRAEIAVPPARSAMREDGLRCTRSVPDTQVSSLVSVRDRPGSDHVSGWDLGWA
jgi:hypothetical protein